MSCGVYVCVAVLVFGFFIWEILRPDDDPIPRAQKQRMPAEQGRPTFTPEVRQNPYL